MDRIGGKTKTNSSTTVSEKAGERKKRGRKRKRRCYQELEVTFKNERLIQENELHENNTI